MLKIGEFSQLGRTTVKTLRHYDALGLLVPAEVDPWTGYRYYTTAQLFDLNRIVSLRQIGFSTTEIADLLAGSTPSEMLARRLEELTSQHARLSDQLLRLNHYMEAQKEGQTMDYNVTLKQIPACTVFSARMIIPSYPAMNDLIPALGERIGIDNPQLTCPEPGYCVNIYHDGEYKETDIDVEVCEQVDQAGTPGEGYTFKELPACQVAAVLHRGPFDTIGAAYAVLYDWIDRNGYTRSGPPRESFIDGPWNMDSPEDYLTEVQAPVIR